MYYDSNSINTNAVYSFIQNCTFYNYCQAGAQDPVGMDEATIKQKKNDRIFLEQLQDTSKLSSYSILFHVKADLRKYQKVRKLFSTLLVWSKNMYLHYLNNFSII